MDHLRGKQKNPPYPFNVAPTKREDWVSAAPLITD